MDVRRNSYDLPAVQMFAYVLRSISEGKSEDQIADRFDGNGKLVKICLEALIHMSAK